MALAGDDVDHPLRTIQSRSTVIVSTQAQIQLEALEARTHIYILARSMTVREVFLAVYGRVAGNGHHLDSQPTPHGLPNFLISCATASPIKVWPKRREFCQEILPAFLEVKSDRRLTSRPPLQPRARPPGRISLTCIRRSFPATREIRVTGNILRYRLSLLVHSFPK